MARYGCLALAVVIAMAVLIFIVFLWSGWLNRPVGHAPMGNAPPALGVAHDTPATAPANGARVAQDTVGC